MLRLTDIFNRNTQELLIRKRLRHVVLACYDHPDIGYICSATVFKGYLINFKIINSVFSVHLVNGNYLRELYKIPTNYGLVQFIDCVRKWITIVTNDDTAKENPVHIGKLLKIKPFENLTKQYHGLRILQRKIIDDFQMGVQYL